VDRNDTASLDDFANLCLSVRAFECIFPHFFTWERGNEQDYALTGDIAEWAAHVARATCETISAGGVSKDRQVQFNQRWGPDRAPAAILLPF
jgi:hypothetical protein